MPVTTNFNVMFNGVPLTNQPSRLKPIPPKAKRFSPIRGGFVSFSQEFGWTFELEWGNEDLSYPEAFTELANLYLNDSGADAGAKTIELSFTWYDGVVHAFDVWWTEAVSAAFRWGSNTERFKIMLHQASIAEAL